MIKDRVKAFWHSIPEAWRIEMASAVHTFIATFVGTILISIQSTGTTSWTRDAAVALLISALRAGVKAVSLYIFSQIPSDSQ